MNVTCPAVASIPSSSSSPCNKIARHPFSANGGLLYSPLHRSYSAATGGCALSFTATSFNVSFFQLPYRRRKFSSSKKVLLVRAGSSTFDFDDEKNGDGIQLARFEEKRYGRGREEPGMVSWSADNEARVSWAPQQQQQKQDRASWSPEKPQARNVWPLNRNAHSGSSSSHSSSLNNQQVELSSSQTLPSRPNISRKQKTGVIDTTAASRLQNRLPAFKQAAEPDTLGASCLSVDGADDLSSNPSNTHKTQRHPPEEGSPRNGSVFTSKLAEILNKFRTREGGFKGSSSGDDRYEERRRNGAAASAAQNATIMDDKLQATRNNVNRLQTTDAWNPPRKDIQHPGNRGFAHGTSVRNEDFNENIYFSTDSSDGGRRDPRGERRLAIGRGSAGGGHGTESASFNVPARSPPMQSEEEGERPLASKTHSRARNGGLSSQGTRTIKSRNNRKSSYFELQEAGHGSTGAEKLSRRGKGTESLSMRKEDQKLHVRRSVVDKPDQTNLDAEDDADTPDSEDDGATSSPGKKADQPMLGSSTGVKTGDHWQTHPISSLPFEIQFSYSETPKAPVIRYREEQYSPFGPVTMGRPWTGGPPLKKSKKNLPVFDSFNPPKGKRGIKPVQSPGPYRAGQGPTPAKSREEILGEPLTGEEIVQMVDMCQNEKRLLNIGRDGLTHNMLDLIHCNWKRRRVIKIRCLGVPTVDMDNLCFHLEDKTGGKIIYRTGGIVYLFRGRNYNYKDRPVIPLMLWKPLAPVYPRLIRRAPGGLTQEEADKLRLLGPKVEPLCTLGKNGVYLDLVNNVRGAFKVDELVRISCCGLNPSDYKKIGAKLRDLVPCVLLSFDDEQILMWKGKASISADLDNLEAAESSDFEAARPSVSCGAGSLDLSIIDTKTKALGDDAMIDGADEESCFTIEDTKQQLVLDTIGVSMEKSDCSISAYGTEGLPGKESFGHSEVFDSHTSASPSWAANAERENISSTNDGISTSSYSSDESHASTVTGAIDEIVSLELVKDDECREKSRAWVYTARSEVNSSSQLENKTSECIPGHKQESNPDEFRKESNLLEEDNEDEVMVPEPPIIPDQPSAEVDSSRDSGASKEGLNRTRVIVCVDALWDNAIASGIAIQLDELEMDSDVIVKKASELAKTVPAGAEYTINLLSKLRFRQEKVPSPYDDLQIHFRNLWKLKNEKKLSKRVYRHRTDVPDKGGLPIEELARLLSIK